MEIDEKWDEPRFIQLEVTWYEFFEGKMKKSVTFDTVSEMIVEDENEWDYLGDTAVEVPVPHNL
jgi:hypothetical protein